MKRRPVLLLVAAIVTAGVLATQSAEVLRIVPLVADEQVVVSFELADALNEDIRQAISSGLRTTFTYDVELRMLVPAWVDRTVATAVITMSDQYDNLTRRHTLSRSIDGRLQETQVTDDESVVTRWLTTITRQPLVRTSRLDPSRDYYVRISAQARPRVSSLVGFASAVVGQAKFSFIP